jgi:hypothetical protein
MRYAEGRNESRGQVFLGRGQMTGSHSGLNILSLITAVIFMFMLIYPSGYVPFIITMLFPLWWLAITISYKSWGRALTWIWACVTLPLFLVVPPPCHTTGYLIGYIYSHPNIFVVFFIYSASYYLMIKRDF